MIVRPKKSLGQHFLIHKNIADDIAGALTFHTGYTRYLEIGPGTGALTRCLLEQHIGKELFVVEIDRDSVAYLKANKVLPNDHILEEDFLRTDLRGTLGDHFGVIGNFPYNISTQILFRVFEQRDQIPEVVGMFQKEVAERIASGPGTKDYGILSVFLQLFYDIEYLFTVPAEAFEPPPKVLSGVIRLKRNTTIDPGCDLKRYIQVVKTAFNQRRKMMRVSLKSMLPKGTELPAHFATERPEQLSSLQFVELTNYLVGLADDATP
jgi:16S rRNA (adenine1518-N6/adenine1519-N6)-dimethyltransferase